MQAIMFFGTKCPLLTALHIAMCADGSTGREHMPARGMRIRILGMCQVPMPVRSWPQTSPHTKQSEQKINI